MSSLTLNKAVVSQVDLGFTKIEGLMLPDGTYAVAVPQVADLFSIPNKNASRDFKALLGKDFSFLKTKSELNSKEVNILTIAHVTKVIYLLSLKGDDKAKELMLALVEEGLDRRFSKAFGQRVTDEEYNARLALRIARLQARRLWTDTLRDRSLELYGIKPTSEQYRLWTVIVNNALFDRDHFFCDRDNMDQMEQETIELFERMARRKAETNPQATPDDLVMMAIQAFS